MPPAKGACVLIYTKATSPVGTTNFIEHVNSVDLDVDGNPKEITEFAAALCAAPYTQQINTIKTLKLSLDCGLELVATGQAILWANWVSGTACYVKVGFGAAGAGPVFEFKANVNAKLSGKPDDVQTVSFDITVADASTVSIT